MEPVEAEVMYVIHTEVAELKLIDEQWFVHFLGSHESLGLGPDKPNCKIGDSATIRISFDAKPS